jgi:type I restriction enzyme S subunit
VAGEVPAHWEVSTLRRVTVDKCDGPFGSGIKSEHYTDEGALVVRLQNIRAGRFHYGEPVFLSQSYFESSYEVTRYYPATYWLLA